MTSACRARVAQAHNLPVLTVIFNNSRYGAVRTARLERRTAAFSPISTRRRFMTRSCARTAATRTGSNDRMSCRARLPARATR